MMDVHDYLFIHLFINDVKDSILFMYFLRWEMKTSHFILAKKKMSHFNFILLLKLI